MPTIPDWDIDNNSNHLAESYIIDFIDISGVLITRDTANVDLQGSLTTSGNVIIGTSNFNGDISLNHLVSVGGDASFNGNVTIVGDISGTITYCSFDANPVPSTAFDGFISPPGPNYTLPTIAYDNNFETTTDVSINGPVVRGQTFTIDGDIQFNDDTTISTYNDNVTIDGRVYTDLYINTDISTGYVNDGDESIKCSTDGKYVLKLCGTHILWLSSTSALYLSTDYGTTFNLITLPPITKSLNYNNDLTTSNKTCAAMSGNGKYMMCGIGGSASTHNTWLNSVIAYSTDYGTTWHTELCNDFFKLSTTTVSLPIAMAINFDGSVIAVSLTSGQNIPEAKGTYVSTNFMKSFRMLYIGTSSTAVPISAVSNDLEIANNNHLVFLWEKSVYIIDTNGTAFFNSGNVLINGYAKYSVANNGTIIISCGWGQNSSTPVYIYKILYNGSSYSMTNIGNNTDLSGVYYGTNLTDYQGITSLSSNSGKYVMIGRAYDYFGKAVNIPDIFTRLWWLSTDYGVTFTTRAALNTSITTNARQSMALTNHGDLYVSMMNIPPFSNKIYRYKFGVFNTSSFNSLNITNTLTAGSYSSSSDYRIKTGVVPLNETITIDNLHPVKYLQTIINKPQYGLIAHELAEQFPDLVNGEKDGEQLQSVDYTGLLPIIIHEIKRLKQKLDRVEGKTQTTE